MRKMKRRWYLPIFRFKIARLLRLDPQSNLYMFFQYMPRHLHMFYNIEKKVHFIKVIKKESPIVKGAIHQTSFTSTLIFSFIFTMFS